MVIESVNFSKVAFYEYGTHVEVFSFDLVFKKPFPTESQEIKLPTSAENTLIGIRYSKEYNNYCGRNQRHINHQLEFSCGKPQNSVEIITAQLNVKSTVYSPVQKIQNVVCKEWYAINKIQFEEDEDSHLYVEIHCNSLEKKTKLHETLDALLISELFSDVVIVSSDGRNFNVHKNIISCNSEVFKAHFLHGTKEETTGKIMSPFDAEVIAELLGYMYSEQVNNMSSVSERLLAAADFYKLDDLKGQCELYISENLTVDNAIEVYKMAYLHSAPYLKKKCKIFIHMHRKNILKSSAWAKFEDSVLMKELCDFLLQI